MLISCTPDMLLFFHRSIHYKLTSKMLDVVMCHIIYAGKMKSKPCTHYLIQDFE